MTAAQKRPGRRIARGDVWGPGELAGWIGMSPDFVLGEIRAGELRASKFGRAWRIDLVEAARYCRVKGWRVPHLPHSA